MPPLQPVRGTSDLLGEGLRRHRHVIETARRITAAYGAGEWSTPIFEDTAVFARTLGETSDVVSKEMYSFADRGGDSLTLRPEGTAGICRALVSNGLTQSLPQRVFYAGPMFRYERPQKGRFRQFHQVGLEIIGPEEPMADAEAVACGRDLLEALGIGGQVTLEINTLGDAPSRLAYRDGLVAFFTQYRGDLSSESLARLERNPLRILDSKHEGDRRLVAQAPTIGAYLSTAAQKFYDGLRAGLEAFGVAFTENPRIVRGLDYYSHTAFEYVTDALGAQNTVLAGGRYDGLVAAMGGPPTGAVGWAAGIERLALLLTMGPPHDAPVVVVPAGNAMIQDAIPVLQTLRRAGIAAVTDYTGNLKKRMQRADRSGARLVVIVDDATRDRAVVQLKDLRNGEQTERACDGLAAAVRERTG